MAPPRWSLVYIDSYKEKRFKCNIRRLRPLIFGMYSARVPLPSLFSLWPLQQYGSVEEVLSYIDSYGVKIFWCETRRPRPLTTGALFYLVNVY